MYTLIIMGTGIASAAMTWAVGYIAKCRREYNEVLEEDNKDACRDVTFQTWLEGTDFKEEQGGRIIYS